MRVPEEALKVKVLISYGHLTLIKVNFSHGYFTFCFEMFYSMRSLPSSFSCPKSLQNLNYQNLQVPKAQIQRQQILPRKCSTKLQKPWSLRKRPLVSWPLRKYHIYAQVWSVCRLCSWKYGQVQIEKLYNKNFRYIAVQTMLSLERTLVLYV